MDKWTNRKINILVNYKKLKFNLIIIQLEKKGEAHIK